jgi:hypothetical protein
MKIKKYKVDPKSWKKDITCNHCQTILEIETSDLLYEGENGDWHDSGWERYSVICAACNCETTISSEDYKNIPEIIKFEAKKRKKY